MCILVKLVTMHHHDNALLSGVSMLVCFALIVLSLCAVSVVLSLTLHKHIFRIHLFHSFTVIKHFHWKRTQCHHINHIKRYKIMILLKYNICKPCNTAIIPVFDSLTVSWLWVAVGVISTVVWTVLAVRWLWPSWKLHRRSNIVSSQ